jgi:hypothetical protein
MVYWVEISGGFSGLANITIRENIQLRRNHENPMTTLYM